MKKHVWLLALLALLLCAGCASKKAEPKKRFSFGQAPREHYDKIKDCKLSLDLSTGSREFTAGRYAELVFLLRNEGQKEVKIPEWFKFDPNNLKVQCQIWLPGTRGPEPDMWLDVSQPVRQPAWRYPLTIPAGETQFVSARLDFPESLVVSPGGERRYFVRAKLNLTSVDLSSPVRVIVFRAGGDTGGKGNRPNNK